MLGEHCGRRKTLNKQVNLELPETTLEKKDTRCKMWKCSTYTLVLLHIQHLC